MEPTYSDQDCECTEPYSDLPIVKSCIDHTQQQDFQEAIKLLPQVGVLGPHRISTLVSLRAYGAFERVRRGVDFLFPTRRLQRHRARATDS